MVVAVLMVQLVMLIGQAAGGRWCDDVLIVLVFKPPRLDLPATAQIVSPVDPRGIATLSWSEGQGS